MRNTLLILSIFIFSCCTQANHCYADIAERTLLIDEHMDLPSKIKIEGGYFRLDFSLKFRNSCGDTFGTSDLEQHKGASNVLVLRDIKGDLVTSSTGYKLSSTKDRLYLIKDQQENLIGTLCMKNTSVSDMFKPIETILCSPEGDVLATTVFVWSAFGFNPIGNSYKTYWSTNKESEPIIVNKHYSYQRIYSSTVSLQPHLNIDPRLIISMLVIHTGKDISTKKNGSIEIQDLQNFSNKVVTKSASFEPMTNEDLQIEKKWLSLKDSLEEITSFVSLSEEEIEAVVAELSAKFQHDDGQVCAEEISQNLDQLTNEEKLVLIYLINAKIDH